MKIIHIEDHLMFAQGLQLLAEQEMPEIDWIIVSTIKETFELLAVHHDVALVLLDLSLTDMNGISFLRTLRLKKLALPVVLMTASVDLVEIKEALDEGAMGFIPKSYDSNDALAAIKTSLQGQPFIPVEYKRELERIGRKGGEKRQKLARAHSLTSRQLEVLELMQHGLANIDIAGQLGVSDNAIKYHVKVLYRSFGVGNRVECIRYAESKGLL